jgi:nuclear pore complex protein Nup98-Nup96
MAPKATPSSPPSAATSQPPAAIPDAPKEGDYWTRPTLAELSTRGSPELTHVPDFTVGRVGYGEITFLKPVDLTGIKSVYDIPGGVIEFSDRSCIVYVDERQKPAPGGGLNVSARISLEKCWGTDRATREFIKDEDHPRHKKQMRILHSKENTKFVSFDIKTGVWVFEVPHFTRYGLDDSDFDDEDVTPPTTLVPPVAPPVQPTSAVPPPLSPLPLPVSLLTAETSNTHGDGEEDIDEDIDEDEADDVLPTSREPRRIDVMQASLFPAGVASNETDDIKVPSFIVEREQPRVGATAFQSRLVSDVSMEGPSVASGVRLSLYIV